MVETAFVLTLLLMLLLGTVTSSIAFSQKNSLENSAREASRYAATLPGPVDSSWLGNVRNVARAGAQGNLDDTVPDQYICVAYYDGSSWSRLTDTSGVEAFALSDCFVDGLLDQARVQVVTRRATTIQAVLFAPDITLEGRAAARYER